MGIKYLTVVQSDIMKFHFCVQFRTISTIGLKPDVNCLLVEVCCKLGSALLQIHNMLSENAFIYKSIHYCVLDGWGLNLLTVAGVQSGS